MGKITKFYKGQLLSEDVSMSELARLVFKEKELLKMDNFFNESELGKLVLNSQLQQVIKRLDRLCKCEGFYNMKSRHYSDDFFQKRYEQEASHHDISRRKKSHLARLQFLAKLISKSLQLCDQCAIPESYLRIKSEIATYLVQYVEAGESHLKLN